MINQSPARYTSIVLVHYSDNPTRSALMKTSIESLIDTVKHLPVEILVINNGTPSDHTYLSELAKDGDIQSYVYNAQNMHFGFARNQGIFMSKGNYVAIVDNDILYKEGWLDKCLEVLEDNPNRKIYATPIQYPTPVMVDKYDQGILESREDKFRLNMRAGSNCFVIRKEDLHAIGPFKYHRVAGSIWTDHAVRAGYLAAVTPEDMIIDAGLRNGYNLSKVLPIERHLLNGEKVSFNQDGD